MVYLDSRIDGSLRVLSDRLFEEEKLASQGCEEYIVEIVAKLSGIDISDINLNCTKTTLSITVDTLKFQYHKTLDLPDIIDTTNPKTSYKNGVL